MQQCANQWVGQINGLRNRLHIMPCKHGSLLAKEQRHSSKSPGMGCSIEGESPVRIANHAAPRLLAARVVQFGSAEQIGRCPSAKAKYCPETDSEQVQ